MSLFATPEVKAPISQTVLIEGLQYIPNFIAETKEQELLKSINDSEWSHELKRRVQHYGYKYHYKSRKIDASHKVGPLPTWALDLAKRLQAKGYTDQIPDQVIVNEYKPGQGIAPHIDCEPCFKDTIISLSLGSTCSMVFRNKDNNRQKVEQFLEPRSLIVLQGEARYKWKHSIEAKKSDFYKGNKYPRETRVSLTFRNVILK